MQGPTEQPARLARLEVQSQGKRGKGHTMHRPPRGREPSLGRPVRICLVLDQKSEQADLVPRGGCCVQKADCLFCARIHRATFSSYSGRYRQGLRMRFTSVDAGDGRLIKARVGKGSERVAGKRFRKMCRGGKSATSFPPVYQLPDVLCVTARTGPDRAPARQG